MALVLMLTLIGAQPAAAAERSRPAGRFAGFWAIVLDLPGAHAALDVVTGWFHGAKSSMPEPPAVTNVGWGIDPNGESLTEPARTGGG